VPFCTSGIRFCEVTGIVFTFRSARPVAFFTFSTMRWQISQPKPTGLPSAPRYEKGIDDSRCATVITPSALTLSSVGGTSASAPKESSTPHAETMRRGENTMERLLDSGCGGC